MMKQTAQGIKERHRAKDERELLFCMKVSLDLLMKLNVKDPEVVGILARGNKPFPSQCASMLPLLLLLCVNLYFALSA